MKLDEPFCIVFLHNNFKCSIGVTPLTKTGDNIPDSFEIIMEDSIKGVIFFLEDKWVSYDIEDQSIVEIIGKCIHEVYKKTDEILEIPEPNTFSLN
jgi:hypothetical protein